MKQSRILIIFIVLCLTVVGGYAQEQTAAQNNTEQEYFNKVRSSMHTQNTDNSADKKNTANNKKNKASIDVWAYIRIIIVLALLIGAIYAIFRVMKKFLQMKEDTGEGVQLLTSRTLGPGKQVQVVFVHGRYLILGVTNENINLLGEITDPKEIENIDLYANDQAAKSGQTFTEMIADIYKRTFGKKAAEKKTFNYETDEMDFIRHQQEKLNQSEMQEDENE